MGVNLRVSSLGWLGVGSCKGFGGREKLFGYCRGFFIASWPAKGCSFGIQVANMMPTGRDVLQAGLGNDTRFDSIHYI
jgi:hypothetical protein